VDVLETILHVLPGRERLPRGATEPFRSPACRRLPREHRQRALTGRKVLELALHALELRLHLEGVLQLLDADRLRSITVRGEPPLVPERRARELIFAVAHRER